MDLLKPSEVAREFRITEATLANWRWAGKGPRFLKAGGRVLYRRADLESWLEAGTAPDPYRCGPGPHMTGSGDLPPAPPGHSWLRVALPVPDGIEADRIDDYAELFAQVVRGELLSKVERPKGHG